MNKELFNKACDEKQEELAQLIALKAILDYQLSDGYTKTYDHSIFDRIIKEITDESKNKNTESM